MLLGAALGREVRQPLSRRQNLRRRLPRQGPGGGLRGHGPATAQRGYLRARSSATRRGGWPSARACWMPPAPTSARRLGPMRGRDGNVHRGRPQEGYMAMISHLGAMISVVSGALMARRFNGETDALGAVSLGEGATSTGAFHEALNQAAVEKLPLLVVVTNNQYAYSTPTSRQFACERSRATRDRLRHGGPHRAMAPTWRLACRCSAAPRSGARRARPATDRRHAAAAGRPRRARRRALC